MRAHARMAWWARWGRPEGDCRPEPGDRGAVARAWGGRAAGGSGCKSGSEAGCRAGGKRGGEAGPGPSGALAPLLESAGGSSGCTRTCADLRRATCGGCGPNHPTSHRPGSECRSPPHRGGKQGSRRGPGRVSSDPALRPLTPPGEPVRRQTVPLHRFGRHPPSTRQQGRPVRPTELSRMTQRHLSALPSTEPLARVACVTERLNFKFS